MRAHGLSPRPPLVVVAGNPNSGKSTVFNALSGARTRVANYPGVTVDRRSAVVDLDPGSPIELTDLPGTYSLAARSREEQIAVESLLETLKAAPAYGGAVGIVNATLATNSTYGVYQGSGSVNVLDTIITGHTYGVYRSSGTGSVTYSNVWGNSTNYTGVAGGLFAFVVGHLSPDAFDVFMSVDFVVMIILGGLGSIWAARNDWPKDLADFEAINARQPAQHIGVDRADRREEDRRAWPAAHGTDLGVNLVDHTARRGSALGSGGIPARGPAKLEPAPEQEAAEEPD